MIKFMDNNSITPCPICGEAAGFHSSICYTYSRVPKYLTRPSGKEAFEQWLEAVRGEDNQLKKRY